MRIMLSEKDEIDLVQYIRDLDNAFYGITINELRKVVFDYVTKKKINHPFNKEKQIFLKRHPPLSLRKPEGVALNRGFELNKTSVEFNIDCETQFPAASNL